MNVNCLHGAQQLEAIEALPPCDELAVIINCGTADAATLALLSALRHFDCPVLVIDCESKDGSLARFESIQTERPFYLLSRPLRPHGISLDWLFTHASAKKIILIDSDLEILDRSILEFMRSHIDSPRVFGSGFIQGPTTIDDKPGTFLQDAVLAERPWIPLTMLRVDRVREALQAGFSFAARTEYAVRFGLAPLARRLLQLRSTGRIPAWVKVPAWLREKYYSHRPEVIYYDTGGHLFYHLRYEREMFMVGLPQRIHMAYCTHFDGMTRTAMNQLGELKAPDALSRIHERLATAYQFHCGD